MTSIQEQTCPLCGTNAEFKSHEGGRLKHFVCSVCLDYNIWRVAEEELSRLPKAIATPLRAEYSALAKAASNDSDLLEVCIERNPNGSVALQAKVVHRSK